MDVPSPPPPPFHVFIDLCATGQNPITIELMLSVCLQPLLLPQLWKRVFSEPGRVSMGGEGGGFHFFSIYGRIGKMATTRGLWE